MAKNVIIGGDEWSDYKDIKMDLKFPEPKEVTVDSKKTLLQIVDMQRNFIGLEVRETKYKSSYIKQIQKLLELAREYDMVVVHQFSTQVRNPYEKTLKPFRPVTEADPSHGPIIDELKPIDRKNEYFVEKFTHDIFFHTYMDDLLARLPDLDTVIVTGTNTNCCVLYTALGYKLRGYKVIVPIDGVICANKETQAMALNIIEQSGIFRATMTLSKMITFN